MCFSVSKSERKRKDMISVGPRIVNIASNAIRKVGIALDSLGASLEVAKYSERLVPSTRFVAVDGIGPTTSPYAAFVAPNASLIGDVTIGKDTSVWYGATVRGDVQKITIGDNCSIGDRSVLHVVKIQGDFPIIIGNGVTVGPGAIIHGATLENNVMVGAGAQVLDGSVVEKGAIIEPGSVVTPGTRVKRNTLWAGSPAKMLRDLGKEELKASIQTTEDNIGLAYIHAEECAKPQNQLHDEELQHEDDEVRDPEYVFQQRKPGEKVDDNDVLGIGSPGIIFDNALSAPEKWAEAQNKVMREHDEKQKENKEKKENA